MAKNESKDVSIVVQQEDGSTKELVLFNEDNNNTDLPHIPEGIIQCTPLQVIFENPGMRIVGMYEGATWTDSEKGNNKGFNFHIVALKNGLKIGFCGTKQLDQALLPLQGRLCLVDIEYHGERQLGGGKRFKNFTIFAREVKP